MKNQQKTNLTAEISKIDSHTKNQLTSKRIE